MDVAELSHGGDPTSSQSEVAGSRWGLQRKILSGADHIHFLGSPSHARISRFIESLSTSCERATLNDDVHVPP